jgi:hypothetical protein
VSRARRAAELVETARFAFNGGNLMTEHTLAPIELNDDELLAVSGGSIKSHAAIVQSIGQEVGVGQVGGAVSIGGSTNGNTNLGNNFTFTEMFTAMTTTNQSAMNVNNGSAVAVSAVVKF